jgi:hypothetical protein
LRGDQAVCDLCPHQVDVPRRVAGHALDAARAFLHSPQRHTGQVELREAGNRYGLEDADQSFRLRKREWPKEHRIDDSEHGERRPDAEA